MSNGRDLDLVIEALRQAGAVFAYVFGSTAVGTNRPDSDLDVAAWFPADAPQSFEIPMPDGVDLLVLNHAPLEIAGRISLSRTHLFADDEVAWARWESRTRKLYLDEKYRIDRSHREFLTAVTGG